ncbi:hypothetical protein [Knoellia sp. p5-6-4]|uniref:hypothetical protein n=1 Tax=unclassified Knoellia TaxID=2618719 RepID=UPI0023DB4BAD|nr:hypothetical protein [Knoellia sp. p5-6-4]MDF2145073.1 hypothetical protein [Knoellia sp. p5-6-4]
MERIDYNPEAGGEREHYVGWIDNRALRGLADLVERHGRSNLAAAGWHDGTMLRSVPTGGPRGIFRAVSTRGGEAQERSNMPFYEINAKGTDVRGESFFEIRFGDGVWMLVSASDLEPPPV